MMKDTFKLQIREASTSGDSSNLQPYLKETPTKVFSCEICKTF